MRLTRLLLLPVLIGGLSVGCGDDDGPSGPTVAQFQGTWNATSIVYSSPTGATPPAFDAFSVGARLNMVITSTGTFTGSFLVPPNPSIPMTGTIALVGTNQGTIDFTWPTPALQANPPITDFTATYALSGNNLTFTRTGTQYPPGHPAAGAPATLVIALTRT